MDIDWQKVRKILIVRLRSIGDTVLTTPSLIALRRFLPEVQIDILLEDWVAPVLDGFEAVDNVVTVTKGTNSRLRVAREIQKRKYDVAINLHGGTTATFFVRASGAKHRIGYSDYSYSFLYNHLLSSSADYWQNQQTHSAEQQLALLGFIGVPVDKHQKTHLAVTKESSDSMKRKFEAEKQRHKGHFSTEGGELFGKFVLFHPTAAFDTKQWATENFAQVGDFIGTKGLQAVAVGTKKEREILDNLEKYSKIPILIFDDLALPEITALASNAKLFVGNDSGIAHISAAVGIPGVVIFGSSNRDHWRPWTNAPNEIVYKEMPCQPCAGLVCEKFEKPKCILDVKVELVCQAIERVLEKSRI